jgi:hypothetical protein
MVAYLDQTGVQHLIAKIRDTFWPVGTILATTSTTSPASYLGGSWEAYAPGRTLVGVDAQHPLNSTGGSATHTISQQELPPHVHDLFAYVNGDTNMSIANFVMNQWMYPGQYLLNGDWHPRLAHTVDKRHAGSTDYPNNPINIEQPYVGVRYWRRIA